MSVSVATTNCASISGLSCSPHGERETWCSDSPVLLVCGATPAVTCGWRRAMPDPALRDKLARIAYEAERGLGVFYGVLWEAANDSDRRRTYRIIDALLASEEWQDMDAVVRMARKDHEGCDGKAVDEDETAPCGVCATLARLETVRGTT